MGSMALGLVVWPGGHDLIIGAISHDTINTLSGHLWEYPTDPYRFSVEELSELSPSAFLAARVAYTRTVSGGAGNDTVRGGFDTQLIDGGDGNDASSSRRGNDTLDGGAGNDVLEAGSGYDRLYGGLGDDTLYGGGGFVWTLGALQSVVRGSPTFEVAFDGDVIWKVALAPIPFTAVMAMIS